MLKTSFSGKIEAGCDEAGRGSLSGPVVAAAVILPLNFKNNELKDSKQLSKKKREYLAEMIKDYAIAFSIGISDVKEIDSINILNASFQAMHRAIDGIHTKIDILLIDGNSFIPYSNTPHKCIIRGDSKFFSIAAASVLSKVHRDYLMKELHNKFPMYNWQKNKGYPTREHRLAIKKHGISHYHRKSFQLLPKESSSYI